MKNDGRPLYEQIKEALRGQILEGKLPADSLAPSEADIIREYGVSSITARRCLNDLAAEGYVQRIKGRGTFVRPLDAAASRRHVGLFYHELISLSGSFVSHCFTGITRELGKAEIEPDLLSWASIRRSASPAQAMTDLLSQRRVDAGILLSPAPQAWLEKAVAAGIPLVSLGFSYEDTRVGAVVADYSAALKRREKQIRELGHHRIAMVREHFEESADGVVFRRPQWDEEAFAIQQVDVPYQHYDRVRAEIRRLVNAAEAPTLYYVSGYELALHVRQFLEDAGLAVPRDASILVAGVSPGPSRFAMDVSPALRFGEEAARMLVRSLRDGAATGPIVRVPATIREGATLGPAPRAKARRKA